MRRKNLLGTLCNYTGVQAYASSGSFAVAQMSVVGRGRFSANLRRLGQSRPSCASVSQIRGWHVTASARLHRPSEPLLDEALPKLSMKERLPLPHRKTVRHAECKNGDHRTGGADSRMLQVELDLLFFVVPDVLCSPCINRQPSRLDAALAGIADMRVGCYEECKKLFCSEAWS